MQKAICAKEAEGVVSWTCEIPFQYVWAKARMRQRELSAENPMELLEREFDTLSRIHLYEICYGAARSLRGVTIQQLEASCPFCEEGKHQVLKSGNWVYIHDWAEEEHDPTEGSDKPPEVTTPGFEDSGEGTDLNEAFFRAAIEAWGDEGAFPAPEPPHGENAYGIDLDDLRVVASGQLSMSLPELEFLSKTYGLAGYFGGLYRCPHCGNVFACVYRDSHHPRRQGRFELLASANAQLDAMLAEEAALEQSESSAHDPDRLVPTMTATVEQKCEQVSVRANVAGRWHELMFDTARGTFLLDGSSYIRYGLDCMALAEHPLAKSGIFGVRELVERLRCLLPPLPDGVELCFGEDLGGQNMLMLIAANRFVGYQASFYNGLPTSSNYVDLFALGVGLPRSYEDLPSYYQITGLPDKKSLKRVLFERADVLYILLQMPDIPFSNVDILRRFFEHQHVVDYLKAINEEPRSCYGWRKFAEAKGDAFVLRFLEENTLGTLGDLSIVFDEVDNEAQLSELFDMANPATKEGFKFLFECWRWQKLHPSLPAERPYEYSKERLQLEWASGEFSVELPRCPKEVIGASVELRNCLKSYAGVISKWDEGTILLMKKEGNTVAAIKVNADLVVSDARGKCNKPIEALDDLNAVFEIWMQARSLRRERQDDF